LHRVQVVFWDIFGTIPALQEVSSLLIFKICPYTESCRRNTGQARSQRWV
jgi:hypothetical protein